jgi:hypothetical protein
MRGLSPAQREAIATLRRYKSMIPDTSFADDIIARHRELDGQLVEVARATTSVAPVVAAASSIIDKLRFVLSLRAKGKRLESMLLAINWPPPGAMPADILDEIVVDYETGNASVDEIEARIVRYYDAGVLEEILAEWENNSRLTHRLPILRAAVRAHVAGLYELTVPALIPQIEGLLGEAFGHSGRMNGKDVSRYVSVALGRRFRFDRAGIAFVAEVLMGNFDWGSPIPRLSRHAILHGADVNYATEANSLRAILLLDQLQERVGYVSSPKGRSYHLVTCWTLGSVKRKRLRRSYRSSDEAEAEGLLRCGHCLG